MNDQNGTTESSPIPTGKGPLDFEREAEGYRAKLAELETKMAGIYDDVETLDQLRELILTSAPDYGVLQKYAKARLPRFEIRPKRPEPGEGSGA